MCDLVTSHVCVEREMEAKAEESASERVERKQEREREREREREMWREREREGASSSRPPPQRSVFSVQRARAFASPPLVTMAPVSEASWVDAGASSRVLTRHGTRVCIGLLVPLG